MNASADAPLAKLRRSGWAEFRRSALYMLSLCAGIAVVLTVIDRGGFKYKLLYSFCIGFFCWLIINGGQFAVVSSLNRSRAAKGQRIDPNNRFPGWGWMTVLMLLGMGLGPVLGTAIANYLTGLGNADLYTWGSSGSQVTIVIAIFACFLSLYVFTTRERLAKARAQAEIAKRAAAENQLKLLESQLEPHMLFNTLANLRVLIALDPPKAQLMLDQLINFLRGTLGASRVAEHALSVEFARLGDYLALLQVRMGDRLQVRFDLPEALRDVPVPPMLLQPLVENCIKHGLEPHIDGGRVEISAALEDVTNDRKQGANKVLVLKVRDTGRGLPNTTSSEGTHFGLQQVRERLHALHQGAASFSLENAAITSNDNEGGTLATIRLPVQIGTST